MPWSSYNMNSDILELLAQQEKSSSGSSYPQPALARLGDASTRAFPRVYLQPNYLNRNDTQYSIVTNSNNDGDAQVVATASLRPANHITNTTPLVAPFIREPHWQELPQPGVMDNGVNNFENPHVHHQGGEQDSPDTIIRCDWPACTYTGTFTVKGSLKRHVNEQHGLPRSFPCAICGKSFSRKANRKNHLLKVHKVRG